MAYNVPSIYKPVWEVIKKEGRAELIVPDQLVLRVRKAIINAKNKDVGFKFINDIEVVSLKITVTAAGDKFPGCSKVSFVRRVRYGITNLEGVG